MASITRIKIATSLFTLILVTAKTTLIISVLELNGRVANCGKPEKTLVRPSGKPLGKPISRDLGCLAILTINDEGNVERLIQAFISGGMRALSVAGKGRTVNF